MPTLISTTVLSDYETLIYTWEEAPQIVRDTKMKARIDGIVSQMQKLDLPLVQCLF